MRIPFAPRRRLLLLAGAAALVVVGMAAAVAFLLSSTHPSSAVARPAVNPPVLDGSLVTAPGYAKFAALRPPEHDQGTAAWLQRHGQLASQSGATCSACHQPSQCLTCHKTPMPHAAGWDTSHGATVLAGGRTLCLRCHRDGETDPVGLTPMVALPDRLNCRTCHGLEMPHPKAWGTAGHGAMATADPSVCATCHTKKTCETCHQTTQVSSCRTCHTAQVTAIDRPEGHATSQCLTCHEQAPAAIGPGPGHETIPGCARCHPEGGLVPLRRPQSVRDWTTENGLGYSEWAKRGSHSSPQLVQCSACHTVHDAAKVSFPLKVKPTDKSCGLSCHTWLDGDVVSRGFLNAGGDPEQTTYRGPISPEKLLAYGTTRHTTSVYAKSGCAGACHQGQHGEVTPCITCHEFAGASPGNLHGTHVPLVTAEQRLADPGNANGQAVCLYCHAPGTNGVREGNTLWKRACYNCHLSGHNPIVPYWKMPSG